MRWRHDTGLDPHRLRSATDLRLEGAAGDSTYGRAAMDVSLSTGLPLSLAAALTLSGGTSVGHLPPQRRWFLGGAYTVRGQSPDTVQSGNAYWLTRAEFGVDRSAYRYMLFGDLGWTGNRAAFRDVGRPMSGVGLGLSMMDGLIRIDMARGLYPRKQNRVSAYLNARF
jgi:hemolysin activation/secretion protein